jgi:hypothetical protein
MCFMGGHVGRRLRQTADTDTISDLCVLLVTTVLDLMDKVTTGGGGGSADASTFRSKRDSCLGLSMRHLSLHHDRGALGGTGL